MTTAQTRCPSVLLVGSIGSGKTTLRQRLLQQPVEYVKTQAIEVFGAIVDTPGEYLEHGRLRHALQLVAYDVDLVLLVISAAQDNWRLPPALSTAYGRPTWGVITHVDVAGPSAVEAARQALLSAGAARVFALDALHGHGVNQLREALCPAT